MPNINATRILRFGRFVGPILLILAIYIAAYYNLRPLAEPGKYSLDVFTLCISWFLSAVFWRRRLSMVVAGLPVLLWAVIIFSGLGKVVQRSGFVSTRAPFSAYEQTCRKSTFSVEGHKIEFCERLHTNGGLPSDIMRDEGGTPWKPDFQESQTSRSALVYHAKHSPDSAIYSIGEILSSISEVKTKHTYV